MSGRGWQRPPEFHRRAQQALRRAQGNRCAVCGAILGSAPISFEHVVPRSLGGRDRDNLLVSHMHCNAKRGSAPPTGCQLILLDAVNTKLKS